MNFEMVRGSSGKEALPVRQDLKTYLHGEKKINKCRYQGLNTWHNGQGLGSEGRYLTVPWAAACLSSQRGSTQEGQGNHTHKNKGNESLQYLNLAHTEMLRECAKLGGEAARRRPQSLPEPREVNGSRGRRGAQTPGGSKFDPSLTPWGKNIFR